MAPTTPKKDENPHVIARPTTFDYFSKLPPELRHEIWKYTYPDFQIHYIIPGPDERHPRGRPEGCEAIKFPNIVSPSPLPVALLVNRDSRRMALEQYRSFPRFPPDAFAPEEMPHGYFNPKTDYLHIPNKMRNSSWNFASAPFPQLTFCISKQDNHYPKPGPKRLYPEVNELSMEIIKLSKQRISLGFGPPTITLVMVDKKEKMGSRCYHIWPAGKPPKIIVYDMIEDSNIAERRQSKQPLNMWIEDFREAIEDELGVGEDKDRYIPRVHLGRMHLVCKCPDKTRLIWGDDGGWD